MATAPLLLRNARTTETGASVVPDLMVDRAGPCSLLRNARTTETGASVVPDLMADRAGPCSLFSTKLQSQLGWRQTIETEALVVGIQPFDEILGGCPRGRITEVIGAPSSGRTSLVHRVLAAAAGRGEYCAVVDSTNAFDPWTASQAGADLDALVWVQCGHNVEHAMKSADLLIHSGGFGVVILDLCDVTASYTRRIPLSWWYRFQRAVEKSPTVLLILGRELHAKSCSSLTVEVRREDAPFEGAFPFQLMKAARYRVSPRKPYNNDAGAFIAHA